MLSKKQTFNQNLRELQKKEKKNYFLHDVRALCGNSPDKFHLTRAAPFIALLHTSICRAIKHRISFNYSLNVTKNTLIKNYQREYNVLFVVCLQLRIFA